MPLKKIDERGNYLDFPGVTVISKINQPHQELWQNIHHFLSTSEVLSHCFSPLPMNSYHMTTCSLATKQEHSNDWVDFISSQRSILKRIHNELISRQFSPSIEIKKVIFSPAIQLIVSMPPQQESILQFFAKTMGLESKVPNAFHITLAYQYREIDEAIHGKIKDEIEQLATICQQYDKEITLSPPQLHYFNSMKQFTPWDASNNPWLSQAAQRASLHLFNKKQKPQENHEASSSCSIL